MKKDAILNQPKKKKKSFVGRIQSFLGTKVTKRNKVSSSESKYLELKEEGAKKAEEVEESEVARLWVIDIVELKWRGWVDQNYRAAAFRVCLMSVCCFCYEPYKNNNSQVQK